MVITHKAVRNMDAIDLASDNGIYQLFPPTSQHPPKVCLLCGLLKNTIENK
jgi:hypothetical protein